MLKVFLRNPVTQVCLFIIIVTALLGLFAPWIAPHDPYENNILMKFAHPTPNTGSAPTSSAAASSRACSTASARRSSSRS